jgi:hypothetical protein
LLAISQSDDNIYQNANRIALLVTEKKRPPNFLVWLEHGPRNMANKLQKQASLFYKILRKKTHTKIHTI